jgi:Ca2+-binding RTX toxin-like protein
MGNLLTRRFAPMNLEPLESRRLLAVTVTEGYPGSFEVVGDDADDTISINVSQKNQTFSLDGQTYTDVQFISVQSGGGQDTINVLSIDGDGRIAAAIDAGPGDDTVTLNFSGAVYGGSGNDWISLIDSYRGGAYGMSGNDFIYIAGMTNDAEISGGEGDDVIDCSNSTAAVVVNGGNGNDSITGSPLDDQLNGGNGTDYLDGGDGNDMFYAQAGSHDTIVGGEGYDVMFSGGNEDEVWSIEEVIS